MEITKWEYKKVYQQDRDKINIYGKQGWEAVGIDTYYTLMKRPCGSIQVKEIKHQERTVEASVTEDFSGKLDQIIEDAEKNQEPDGIEM